MCCREVCTLTAVVAQWVEPLPATQLTGNRIPDGVHIGILYCILAHCTLLAGRGHTGPMLTDCVVHTATVNNNSLLPFNKMFFKEVL